jgi:hypothetical protein
LTAEALALARARGWVSRRNLHQWETHYAPIMAVDLFKTVVDDSGVLAEILSAVDEEKR